MRDIDINPIPYGLRLHPVPYGGHMAPYLKSQKIVFKTHNVLSKGLTNKAQPTSNAFRFCSETGLENHLFKTTLL